MEQDKDQIITSFIGEFPDEINNRVPFIYNKENFVWYKNEDVSNDYDISEDVLGQGSFGVVLKGIHKQTQQERALKVIPRSKITRKIDRFINEVNALKKLDHPNVIRLYEVYETETDVILVQEICSGGELLKRFDTYDTLNEHKIANVFKQILLSIEYCHQNTIVHRDLKPENFMLTSEKEDARVKLIDFGLATRLNELKKGHKSGVNGIKSRVGTIMFMAPEVISQDYNYKCDLWSAGVILYILVSGYPPFYGESEYETISKILDADYNYDQDVWNVVTPELKDLIDHLLCPQSSRFNAEDALEHEWIRKHDKNDAVLSKDLPNCLKRIKRFAQYDKLQKIWLTYFCTRMQDSKLVSTGELFQFLDKNKDGVLSAEELKEGLNCDNKEFKRLFYNLDADKNGFIDYTEWIAAAKNWDGAINEDMVIDAFNAFDLNSDGEIDSAELKKVFLNEDDDSHALSKVWKSMIDEVDKDGDGKVKLPDLMKMFESKLFVQ
jgi:calcium-dependent protein kinase